jgi:hypothetical protein
VQVHSSASAAVVVEVELDSHDKVRAFPAVIDNQTIEFLTLEQNSIVLCLERVVVVVVVVVVVQQPMVLH